MAPTLITQAARRGKRIIASPTPSPSASGVESEGEEELESEEEEIVLPKRKDKGKGRAVEPSPPAESDEMNIDSSEGEDELGGGSEADPLDVIMDEDESESGEEEKDEDDYEEEEEEEEEEVVIKPTPVVMRPPPTVPTPRAARVTAPAPAVPSPSLSSASTPGIKGGLRLRLNVSKPSPLGRSETASQLGEGSGRRPPRESAKKAAKKTKEVAIEAALGSDQDAEGSSEEDELEDEDELEEEEGQGGMEIDVAPPYREQSEGASSRAVSPTKMTARQRAKGNADLQGILIALPSESSGAKKLILTDAERVERREEMARRRKRQTDQKMLDEQEQTINRLLRAQTGRSRNKIEAPDTGSGDITPNPDGTPGTMVSSTGAGDAIATGGKRGRSGPMAVKAGMIRWVSNVTPAVSGEDSPQVRCRVGIPTGSKLLVMEDKDLEEKNMAKAGAECGVSGCTAGRKYRSTKVFEMGGCSVEHLKQVNEELGARMTS